LWAQQKLVKLMPESRAAFELVHRPMRQLFTASFPHNPKLLANGCGGISPDFRFVCIREYCRESVLLNISTQRFATWSGDLARTIDGSETSFSTSGRYCIEFGVAGSSNLLDCRTGDEVGRKFQEKGWFKDIFGLSPDERFIFLGCKKWDSTRDNNNHADNPHKLQVFLMTGRIQWEFELPNIHAVICLPDNDSLILYHSSSISKFSISSRSLIISAAVPKLCARFCRYSELCMPDSLKHSPDGEWFSIENAVVNSRTLQVTVLPSRNMKFSPVFFLPGSKTAIFAKQVFSLVDGRWTLRISPMSDALPLIDYDDCGTSTNPTKAFNLVTRSSGSDIFFRNLSFACAQTGSGISLHLQDP